jgi:DNA-binding beta-propeller fold protein YncE
MRPVFGLTLAAALALPSAAHALSLEKGFRAGKRIAHGEGATNYPSGVAVDPGTGDVFVMDLLHNQVQRFDANGVFKNQWDSRQGLGLTVDPGTHNVWVAMWTKDQVRQYSPAGELLLTLGTGKRGKGNDQFNRPHDVSVDPTTGDLYVLDTFNKRVQVFGRDGKFKRGFDGPFIQPFGIAVHPKGEWLVIANTANRELIKMSLEGEILDRWKRPGSQPGEFRWPRNVAVDAEGHIYVADTDNERAQELDQDGNFVRFIQGPNDREHGSFHPRAIDVNSANGEVYACAAYASRVDRFDADGGFVKSFGHHEKDGPFFNVAKDVAVSPITGDIFVSDWMDHRIKVFTPDGEYKYDLDGWVEPQTDHEGNVLSAEWRADPVNGMWASKEHQAFPGALEFDADGLLWWNRGSMHYDDDPRPQADWVVRRMTTKGSLKKGFGHDDFPRNARMRGLTVDKGTEHVYVANSYMNTVMKFTFEGELVWQIGAKGAGEGQFDFPVGISVDPRNHDLLVVDARNHRVVRLGADGSWKGAFGEKGKGPGQFHFSDFSQISVDAAGTIWLADSMNHRVQAVGPQGKALLQHGQKGFGGWGKYSGVSGLHVEGDKLYVIDNGGHELEVWSIVR